MEKILPDLAALEAEAAGFVRGLLPRPDRATVVTLSGELGAGKTAFVKAAASALGVTEPVTSPTFVLEKRYPLTGSPFRTLIHVDAYRLKSGADLAPLHFDETLRQADNLIMLEWPEIVADALPDAEQRITITVGPTGARHLTYA